MESGWNSGEVGESGGEMVCDGGVVRRVVGVTGA